MNQVMVSVHVKKTNMLSGIVGNEAKNPLPTIANEFDATDLIGLSWIFLEDDFVTC